MPFVKKRGRHGTLYKYKIRYTDPVSRDYGTDVWFTYAYDAEHALEKFYDADDGFEAVSNPVRVKEF